MFPGGYSNFGANNNFGFDNNYMDPYGSTYSSPFGLNNSFGGGGFNNGLYSGLGGYGNLYSAGTGLGSGQFMGNGGPSGLDRALFTANRSLGLLQNLIGTTTVGARSLMQLSQSSLLFRSELQNLGFLQPQQPTHGQQNPERLFPQQTQSQLEQIGYRQREALTYNPLDSHSEEAATIDSSLSAETTIIDRDLAHHNQSDPCSNQKEKSPAGNALLSVKQYCLRKIPPFPQSYLQAKGLFYMLIGYSPDTVHDLLSISNETEKGSKSTDNDVHQAIGEDEGLKQENERLSRIYKTLQAVQRHGRWVSGRSRWLWVLCVVVLLKRHTLWSLILR